MADHRYAVTVRWTGNTGEGTRTYRSYDRAHELSAAGKSIPIHGSSDPAFRGDASRYNPEELLVGSLSACHMLWFLHLASEAGVVVTAYVDAAEGVMREHADGSGEFERVTLRPCVSLADASRASELEALHQRAHAVCFIARSVKFPVVIEGAMVGATARA